ncbi:MAG: hypothetical protein V1837_04415 [Candidatus Woesearchaeota archaeon]
MKYKAKSVIIGRKKREKESDDDYPCFVSLFSVNNPHVSGKVPDKILEFKHTDRVNIDGLDIIYLPAGNDLIINDLAEFELMHETGGHLYIKGKQKK